MHCCGTLPARSSRSNFGNTLLLQFKLVRVLYLVVLMGRAVVSLPSYVHVMMDGPELTALRKHAREVPPGSPRLLQITQHMYLKLQNVVIWVIAIDHQVFVPVCQALQVHHAIDFHVLVILIHAVAMGHVKT